MAATSRTFEVMDDFVRTQTIRLKDGTLVKYIIEKRDEHLRFTLQKISAEGFEPVYIDHATHDPILFTETELQDLMSKSVLVERFPRPKVEP